jgi:hypothetical protein
MRLLGYPAQKISILTTYNGQKFLIRDVLNKRCAKNPLLGMPMKVRIEPKLNDLVFENIDLGYYGG